MVPNSDNFEITGINPWRNQVRISVKAAPKKGAANKELLNELESILGCPVKILSGEKSRSKKILIEGLSENTIVDKLNLKELI